MSTALLSSIWKPLLTKLLRHGTILRQSGSIRCSCEGPLIVDVLAGRREAYELMIFGHLARSSSRGFADENKHVCAIFPVFDSTGVPELMPGLLEAECGHISCARGVDQNPCETHSTTI